MSDQDNLRDRIANLIEKLDNQQMIYDGKIASPDDIAQAIIDEFGLTVETHAATHAKRTMTRITGQWEWEN